jgi:membrane protease YdiL (CAAX protease family)
MEDRRAVFQGSRVANAANEQKFFLEKTLNWWVILCLYVASLLMAAIVSPVIIRLLVFWNIKFPNHVTAYVLAKGFRVTYDRIHLLCFALALLPFGWKALRNRRVRPWVALETKPRWSFFWKFFVIGVMLDLVLISTQMLYFPFTCIPWSLGLLRSILWYGVSACAIAFLEECFFRACLLGSLLRSCGERRALLIGALIFAYSHFRVSRLLDISVTEVTWASGFFAMYWHLVGIFKNFELVPFAILVVLGVVLSQLVLFYRSLLPAIGFHMGIVWTLMIYKKCVDMEMLPHSFLGTWRLMDAPVTLCVLLGMSWVLHLVCRRRKDVLL